ncbi:Thiamine pyrophosphokinase [Salix suchowensis]|nr:Thiamine pyrophosphokinase [Salix suchowensis]
MAARSPQKKARPVKQESGPLRRASTRKSIQRTSVPENDVSSAAEASGQKLKRREETPEEDTDDDDTADDPKEYDSDALDDDSDDLRDLRGTKTKSKKASSSPRKRRRTKVSSDDPELAEGQEIIGKVQITWRVDYFSSLIYVSDELPVEPVYRAAEKEWKAFVESFTDLLAEVDAQVIIYFISLSLSVKSSQVIPGGESLIAAGSWCPGKNELAAIRANILRNPNRLRQVISEPEFVEWFGAAERPPDGERSNIFGMEDELKVAPKGIDKTTSAFAFLFFASAVCLTTCPCRDIDLLKCRSFAVVHRFLDTEVLDPEFKNKLADVARVMMPFVHWYVYYPVPQNMIPTKIDESLNDMMTLPPDDNDGDEDQAEQGSGHGSE